MPQCGLPATDKDSSSRHGLGISEVTLEPPTSPRHGGVDLSGQPFGERDLSVIATP